MPQKIFAEKIKTILLGILTVIFLAFGFWLVQPTQKAGAACGAECITQSGVCKYDEVSALWGVLPKVCTINIGWDPYRGLAGFGTSECSSGSGSSARLCLQTKCPLTVDSALNGKPCEIRKGVSFASVCTDPQLDGNGFWDASRRQCVTCAGNKVKNVCGNSISISTDGSGNCTGTSGANTLESACPGSSVSAACEDLAVGAKCSGGTGTCNLSGQCVPISSGILTITATPNTITQNTPTNIEFTVTSGGSNINDAAVSITGVGTGGTCNTAASGKCTISAVKATSTGTATATASKATYTNGTANITAQAAPACPKGSGVGVNTSFAVDFRQSQFTTNESFKISYMIPPEYQDGAVCIYAPGASSPSYSKNETSTTVPKTNSNYDTGYKPTTAGTWKITINNSSSCSATSTCFATANVVGAAICTNGTCNPSNSAQYCSGGSWVNCSSGTCQGGTCVPSSPGPVCIPNGAGCSQPANCCSGNCSNGTCTAAPPPATSPPPATPLPPSAGPCGSGTTNYRSPLSYCSIQELIQGATGWVLGLVSSIIILFLVYGGIMYVTAAGEETQMEKAKNIIYYAILGLVIILISYTLITEVKTILKVR